MERNETGDNAGNEHDRNWELVTQHGGFSLKDVKIMNVKYNNDIQKERRRYRKDLWG